MSKTLKASSDSDIQLQEFINVMQPRVNSKLWTNDTIGDAFPVGKAMKSSINNKQKSNATEVVQNHLNEDEMISPKDDSVEESLRKLSKATKDDVISDIDYFKSKVKTNWSDSDSDDDEKLEKEEGVDAEDDHLTHVEVVCDQREHVNEDIEMPLEASEDLKINCEKTSSASNDETGRLFVQNFPFTTK